MPPSKGPTVSMIGSYPLDHGKLGSEAIIRSVDDQIEAGLNLVTDGQTRADMIALFAERTGGMEMAQAGMKARIVGKTGPPDATDLVDDLLAARERAAGRAGVKAIVTGPVTMVFSSELATDVYRNFRDPELYMDMASSMLGFARAFAAAGFTELQIDEPYLSVGAPMKIAREAIESVARCSGMNVALHVCGDVSKDVPDGEGGKSPLFEQLLSFKGIRCHSHAFFGQATNLPLIDKDLIGGAGKKLGLGCIDTTRREVEDPVDVASLIRRAVEELGWERLTIHPDCGLRPLPYEVAGAKLRAMTKGLSMVEE